MLYEVITKIISLEIFEKRFVCDLGACKGDCCVEGESGAPIDDKEAKILEDLYPKIKSYLTPKAIEVIEKQGVITSYSIHYTKLYEFLPIIRARRMRISCMVLFSMCPMCNTPVTFGGGITMVFV